MSSWLSDALLRTQTDERLVALTRGGHERAFAAIVERYRRPLLAFARSGGASEERAEDVVQQALMSAWAALAAGADVAHLRGWLHQVVRHEAIRAAKREGRDVHDELDTAALAGSRGAESEAEQRLHLRETLAGIAGLPQHQREALVQTAVEGRSRSEVAATLGLSEGAVRQLVHRARSTLRTAVTAVTPLPLASWAAAAGGGGGPGVVELAAGAGTATIGGVLLKTGVAVVATGAIATGVTVSEHRGDPGPRATPAPALTQSTGSTGASTTSTSGSGGSGSESGDDHGGGDRSGHGGGGRSGPDDRSGHGSGSSGHGSGHEGSGSSGGSGSGSGSGSGGHGSDDG